MSTDQARSEIMPDFGVVATRLVRCYGRRHYASSLSSVRFRTRESSRGSAGLQASLAPLWTAIVAIAPDVWTPDDLSFALIRAAHLEHRRKSPLTCWPQRTSRPSGCEG